MQYASSGAVNENCANYSTSAFGHKIPTRCAGDTNLWGHTISALANLQNDRTTKFGPYSAPSHRTHCAHLSTHKASPHKRAAFLKLQNDCTPFRCAHRAHLSVHEAIATGL